MKGESLGIARIALVDAPGYRVQILLRLCQSYTRAHLADDTEEVIATAVQHLICGLQGEPDTFVDAGADLIRKTEALWHHAYNGAGQAADLDRAPQDTGIRVEALAPQSFREERYLRSSRLSFGGGERPAQSWLGTEHLEDICRHPRRHHADGPIVAFNHTDVIGIASHRSHLLRLVANIAVVQV